MTKTVSQRGDSVLAFDPEPYQSRSVFEAHLRSLADPQLQGPPALNPNQRRPIVIIGAGSIIHDGHGPAYQIANLPIIGVYDRDPTQAERVRKAFQVETLCPSLEQALELGAGSGAVFDIALPPDAILEVVEHLPRGAGVLIQKPLGKNLDQALAIRKACRDRQLVAGINFQLPFSPQIVSAFRAYQLGLIGPLRCARVELELFTQWSTWEFLLREPRIEVLLHSIHYLSLFAFYFGTPESLESTQRGDPSHAVFKDRDICTETRLHYRLHDKRLDIEISCNHLSTKPRVEWRSDLVLTGTQGEIRAGINDNLDYPAGVDDALRIEHREFGSHDVVLVGNRFPWGFVATMTEVQRAVAQSTHSAPVAPRNDLDFAALVMALTETCYDSNARGGASLPIPAV